MVPLALILIGVGLWPLFSSSSTLNSASSTPQTVKVDIPGIADKFDKFAPPQTTNPAPPQTTNPAPPQTANPAPPQTPDASIEIPGSLFDELRPHDTGLTASRVACAAAGVSILVALISLSGVWKTVKDKWRNDQVSAVWARFTWVVDTSQAKFLTHNQRNTILTELKNKANKLNDTDLQAVVKEWLDPSLNNVYDQLREGKDAAANAITLIMNTRDDKSQPSTAREEARNFIDALPSMIVQKNFDPGQTVQPPAGAELTTPASAKPIKAVSRRAAGEIMNEATALALGDKAVQTQRDVADRQIHQTLAGIADAMPARVDHYAKVIAHQQPQVTKYLNRDGVKSLRDELSKAVAALADKLRQSATQIRWRDEQSASTAVFQFLYGRVRQFDDILKKYGYYIDPHSELTPDSLFDEENLDEVERQLALLYAAENAVQHAKAVDDQDSVDSLWNDDTDAR